MISQSNLSPIIDAFKVCENGRLMIKKEHSDRYSIQVKPRSFWETYFPCFQTITPEHKTTLQNLKEIIGDARLKRIFQKNELSLPLDKLINGRLVLTRDVVQRIFVGLGDVRLEDLKDSGRTFSDELYRSLIPFDKVEEIFFHRVPSIGPFDNPKTSGQGYQGLKERVWTILSHKNHTDIDSLMITEAELLTSRIADREVPEGTVVRLHRGYFVCEKIFCGGGAFVSLFRDLQGQEPPIILCRGTAMRLSAKHGILSGINDLLVDIGSHGFHAIRNELYTYLKEQNIHCVDVFGKSLGGATAKYIAASLQISQIDVRSLTLTCSVGVNDLITRIIDKYRIPTNIIRNAGQGCIDHIPLLGGIHPCHTHVRLFYIGASTDTSEEHLGIPNHTSVLWKIWHVLRSFGKGHTHQVTLNKFSFREVKGEELQTELSRGKELEGLRAVLAKIFNRITFGYFNTPLRI